MVGVVLDLSVNSSPTMVVSVLDRIARQCGVKKPTSWVTATRQDHEEIRDDFFLEAIENVLDRFDLPSPIGAQEVIIGTGAESYALPTAFRRLQRDENSVYEKTTVRRAGIPMASDGDWTYLKDHGLAGADRFYRLTGYEGNFSIEFNRALAAGEEVTVSYVTNNWMADADGTVGKRLAFGTDALLLPRLAVEAGTVWRFRERRGLPYEDKYKESEMHLARLSNDRNTMRTVSFGDTEYRKPWDVPVPSMIKIS